MTCLCCDTQHRDSLDSRLPLTRLILPHRLLIWQIIIVLHDDTRPIPLHIIELTALRGPNEYAEHDETEQHHAGNQCVDDFHGTTSECARHFR
uniref:Uncharacterized protein n=1 Tax=Candidatus Kentrum sp. FW TaxID=2126338 RepID=A0A450U2L6_9GAMM|nr:MAG: hypothetical protein BECKFW1821C_GA0114237_11204 [Candidatus Kentron sp. FW]